jgi:hypothetical protein
MPAPTGPFEATERERYQLSYFMACQGASDWRHNRIQIYNGRRKL